MAIAEQAGSVLPLIRPAWGGAKFTFGMKEGEPPSFTSGNRPTMLMFTRHFVAVETHLDTAEAAATSATSTMPPKLRRARLSNATETRGPTAVVTEPLDNEEVQVATTIIANVDIDHGGVPPKLGRVQRKVSAGATGETTTPRVNNEKVRETAVIDANVDANIDHSGAPPALQRAWGNVPPAVPSLAARDQAAVRVNKDQAARIADAHANAGIADSGFPPKFQRALGNTGSPTPSRATPTEGDSNLPAKLRRTHNPPPSPTNLGPATDGPTSARVGLENGEAPQARPLAVRAEPVVMVPIEKYQRYILNILQAHGVLPEEPGAELLRYVVDILQAHGFLPEAPAPAPVVAAADSKGDNTGSDDEEEKGVEQWSVFDEKKVSWKELCRLVKPTRRVAKKIPVQRELRSAAKAKKTAGPTDAGKATEIKPKSNKNISEAIKVAVRAAKKVAEAKTISTRRRKVAVKTTVRAKKVVRAKAAGRKTSTRGRGAAKAAATGNTTSTRRVKLIVRPQKKTSEVNLTAGERPPLSASATHNTPSKSSAPKVDEGSESISARPHLTIKLPAMKVVEQKDEATGANTKENPGAAVTESAEVDEKAPRRSTRNAEKSEAPKAKGVKEKPAAGRPKRKEMHEGGREERDRAKRTKKDDAKPAEEVPRAKIMLRIPKRLTREEIATKLRRSARPKKASFKL
ncbi:hypothetical protein BDN71DRAFT_1450278 [Pleurotus eryngii]|uniref:Uncharacterized protein n=1 Tax=Pleurotus eryngii TaxID=5323 RepID=A0A9P5ZUL8_PLEER|nr:hypothetical protein BDN71DRAFT_1450278 [Pleurotus eryngii]